MSDKLQELISTRDRTADIGIFADEALAAWGGTKQMVAEMKLICDDERTMPAVKARIMEKMVDFILEASKMRKAADPADGLTDADLAAAIKKINGG